MDFEKYLNQPLPFDSEISKFFKRNQHMVIFDIGACEGEDSIKLQKKFPNALIYSFEPLPKNINRIRQNFRKFGLEESRIINLALSDKDGESSFYVSSGHPEEMPKTVNWDYGNKSSSLLPPKEHIKIHSWVKFDKRIKVKTRRLDSFCSSNNIDHIDFAFIDVQGAELMVLNGAGEILNNISMIWLEVESVELYKNQPLKNEVELFMEGNGFKCIKNTVDNISGDQLYVRQELLNNSRSIISRLLRNKSQ